VVSQQSSAPLEPALAQLAGAYGVGTDYWDWQGRHVLVARPTVVAVLAALGVEASTPEAVAAALSERRLAPWRRMLPAVVVARTDRPTLVRVHVPHGAPVEVWAELEDSGDRRDLVQQQVWVDPCEVDGCLVGEATFAVPGDLPLGWHRLRARSGADEAACPLVMTPAAVGLPAAMRHRRTWGFMTQLYSVRSARSWGLGDLADLAELAGRSGAELGAGFVLVNPLHAAEPVAPMEPSPYLPTSRRFVNPIYLRVEDVPEWAYLVGPDRLAVDRLAAAVRVPPGSDRERDLLDRDAVWAAKAAALTLVHALPRSWARQRAYERFRAREGQGLVDFATWCVLAETHGSRTSAWPAELRDPAGPAVAAFRHRSTTRVDFYCWLHWFLDEQLGAAGAAATAAGMPAGLVLDLAVGVHRDGADAWMHRDVLAEGVSVGAPPDAFNQQGQDWSQPPWRPDRLAETGYAPYRDLLRTLLRHAGGIRVDHVMGLFRLWWVPDGHRPNEGTYVRADHEAMVGILALEAVRAGAFVVGEDLGGA
jgi:4-alpha-glucanotransferase